MRLFIGINFNDETRARLIDLREELRSRSLHGNFTHDENLHLTLAFIGEVSPKQADKIKAIMDTIAFEPYPVTIERLGAFSRGVKKSVAIWWAGLREVEPLMKLQYEVQYKLALCGFEMDGRKYHPHITLGREVVNESKPWAVEPFGETITSIDLMKSERIGGKLTYTAIHTKVSRKA